MNPSEKSEQGLAYERVVFFSDAVFAIAITLLVIDIQLPSGVTIKNDQALIQALRSVEPEIFSFLISFFVIGSYWLAHHTMFTYVTHIDTRLIWLNLLFLLFIAITPFPTRVVGEYGDLRVAQLVYALDVVATGLAKYFLWIYATRGKRLVPDDLSNATIRHNAWRSLVVPGFFLLSIPFIFTQTGISYLLWTSSIPGYFILNRYLLHHARARVQDS